VLSIFDEPLDVLDRWLEWLEPGGWLFVFGRFNSRQVDTKIQFRNRFNSEEWEGGFTSYSTRTVGEHLDAAGATWEFERFRLPIDLEEREDPIRTWTVTTDSGERIVMNGANVVAEHHFLTVRKG
jgi:hypothetical protein